MLEGLLMKAKLFKDNNNGLRKKINKYMHIFYIVYGSLYIILNSKY